MPEPSFLGSVEKNSVSFRPIFVFIGYPKGTMSWKEVKTEFDLDLEPIRDFPGRKRTPEERERATFSATFKDTLKLLKLELGVLRARDLVLQVDLRPGDLDENYLPRETASSLSPAIVLLFESRYGFLRIGSDRFKRWEHNLRAIALHLQHLRESTVYGVGSSGEPYRGWVSVAPPRTRFRPRPPKAKPAPGATEAEREAAGFLARFGGKSTAEILGSAEAFGAAYRAASAVLHPDRGGAHEEFLRLQQAVDRLRVRFGES